MSNFDQEYEMPRRIDAESITTSHVTPRINRPGALWGWIGYFVLLAVVVYLGVLIGHQQYQINILETKVDVLDGILGNLRQGA